MQPIKILAIPGSLRANSSSHKILELINKIAPDHVNISIYPGIGNLPLFDDSNPRPPAVQNFQNALSDADAVIICTPEYAFGVPGSLKNAIDWTVGSAEFYEKPVALITASSSGEKAHASLLLTLEAIGAKIPEGASLLISFIRSKIDSHGNVHDEATIKALHAVVNNFVASLPISIDGYES